MEVKSVVNIVSIRFSQDYTMRPRSFFLLTVSLIALGTSLLPHLACPIGYAGIAASGTAIIISSVVATGGADIEVTPIAFDILGTALSGFSLYLACSS